MKTGEILIAGALFMAWFMWKKWGVAPAPKPTTYSTASTGSGYAAQPVAATPAVTGTVSVPAVSASAAPSAALVFSGAPSSGEPTGLDLSMEPVNPDAFAYTPHPNALIS